jgi:hypothetical protein
MRNDPVPAAPAVSMKYSAVERALLSVKVALKVGEVGAPVAGDAVKLVTVGATVSFTNVADFFALQFPARSWVST